MLVSISVADDAVDYDVAAKVSRTLRPAFLGQEYHTQLHPSNNFASVQAFHRKFGIPVAHEPSFLDPAAFLFRCKFMQEELDEFKEDYAAGNMLKAADALIDLTVVTMGPAGMGGLQGCALWRE